MVALLSWPAGSLVGRMGASRLVAPGVLLFAAGCLWSAWSPDSTPDYWGVMFPSTVLVGIGVALTFPILAGAAVSQLPPARSATGSALFNMSRQIGGVVGIAVFVAILGAGVPDLDGFRAGWIFMAGSALAAGAMALALPARGSTQIGVAAESPRATPAPTDAFLAAEYSS